MEMAIEETSLDLGTYQHPKCMETPEESIESLDRAVEFIADELSEMETLFEYVEESANELEKAKKKKKAEILETLTEQIEAVRNDVKDLRGNLSRINFVMRDFPQISANLEACY